VQEAALEEEIYQGIRRHVFPCSRPRGSAWTSNTGGCGGTRND
jgi:hypothetical protein